MLTIKALVAHRNF